MKKILIIVIIIIFIFLIYLTSIDKMIYYLNLSDNYTNQQENYSVYYKKYLESKQKLEKYINEFDLNDYRITDLIRMIEENKEIKINNKNQTIKNALIKSDLITLSIGMNDINYKIKITDENKLYDYADEIANDMEQLFSLIKKYCKEKIVYIGLYNSFGTKYDEIFRYLNTKIEILCHKYNIIYLNISDLFSKQNVDKKQMNEKKHILINEKLIEKLDF
ncbi:MAG: SGNH/GDSL hydrolase family protein [Bacilli bacterium]|nr:SGNH/GDSL hydrolase family protein [Bacilli bacterium]